MTFTTNSQQVHPLVADGADMEENNGFYFFVELLLTLQLRDEARKQIALGNAPYWKSYKNNPKNNGSESQLKSLRDYYARKKGRPEVETPVAQKVNENLEFFADLLIPFRPWLQSNNEVIIYDTESDGVGATHALDKTREYHFHNVKTGTSLNIWARRKNGVVNSDYNHLGAARQILSFIESANFLIAYEPPSNDRNGLKSLLGKEVYAAQVNTKVIDFKRSIINSLFTTDKSIYLRGLTQPDVYDNLLQVGSVSFSEPQGFLSIPDTWRSNIDMKCRVDVHMLHNLFIYFQSVRNQ